MVILDRTDFENKLLNLIKDPSMFAFCDSKRTETLTKKINSKSEQIQHQVQSRGCSPE